MKLKGKTVVNCFFVTLSILMVFIAFTVVRHNDKVLEKASTTIIVTTGDGVHDMGYIGAKYATVVSVEPFGTSDVIVLKVKIAGEVLEQVAYTTTTEKIKSNDRVIVNSLSHRDNRGFNYSLIATQIPNDHHGF